MKQSISILILMIFFHNPIYGQVISGTIVSYDFDGFEEQMFGASVVVKGTNRWAVTDIDGKYQIEIDSTHNILPLKYKIIEE
jgi:hypothetical protein